MRKCEPQFYACEEAEAVLRSKLNKYTREKPNYLHVALFFSITDEARDIMENRVKAFSEEFENTMFIIPSEVFTPTAQTHFIDNSYFSLSGSNYKVTLRLWAGTNGSISATDIIPSANREDYKVSQIKLWELK